ncbi:MAG: hypothetical protein LBE34_03460 [Flavobacteriaceae bacterium]|jgi:hypothetical protein|nr:hypothetical protein [Flavobacteriaceae bacterium]
MSKLVIIKIALINLLLTTLVSCTKDDDVTLSFTGAQKSALMGKWKMIEEVEYDKKGNIVARNFVNDETCPPEEVEFLEYDLATQVTYSKRSKVFDCDSDKVYKEYNVVDDKLYVGYGKDLENNAEYEIEIVRVNGNRLELEHQAYAKPKRGYGQKTVKVKTYYYRTR